MASPNTIAFNVAVEKRSAAVRADVAAKVAETHPSRQRTSHRWIGRRTKGMPYSRMTMKGMGPGSPGRPALIALDHPTRKRGIKHKRASLELLQVFFPNLPSNLVASMLGR